MSIRKYIDIINESSELGDPEGKMSFSGINYDQVNGLGNVPYNANIKYMGFACFMMPRQFSSLARRRDFNQSSGVDHLMKAIENGEPIGSPFLSIILDRDDPSISPIVTGHEGRTRMEAIRRLYGEIPVMVHCFPREVRARDISLDHIRTFQKTVVPQDMTTAIPGHYCNDTVYVKGWQTL